MNDLRTDAQAHGAQAQQVMQDYLAQTRKEMIAWGCNAPCATGCTSSLQALGRCNLCACSHSAFTISANPQGMQ